MNAVHKITTDAMSGTSESIDNKQTPTTSHVGLDFATIEIQTTTDDWS